MIIDIAPDPEIRNQMICEERLHRRLAVLDAVAKAIGGRELTTEEHDACVAIADVPHDRYCACLSCLRSK